MPTDTIVAEVRQVRDSLAKRFNDDLRAMLQDAKERQASGGRRVVSFPPRPARRPTRLQQPIQEELLTGVGDPS
jgi:hypothetical protein